MPLPDCRIASPAVENAARRRLCSAGGNSKQFESHVPHVLCSDTVTVLNVSLCCLVFVVVVVVACVCVYLEELFKAEYFHIAWFDRRQRLKKKFKKKKFFNLCFFAVVVVVFSRSSVCGVTEHFDTLCSVW